MKYSPHNYQKYAIEFIKQHPIAAILLDMGMGKTSIVLSALNELMYDSFEVTKVLIIAPLRVARNTWSDEIKKWDHLKGLRYSIVVGSAAERKKALAADADIFIINRENVQWLVEQSGVPVDFDLVVIDELSSFKNWQAKRFKSFMKVRPMVKRVVGLTDTPSSNGLMDLFAEFKVLDMGERLGRFIGQYRVNYFNPDRMNSSRAPIGYVAIASNRVATNQGFKSLIPYEFTMSLYLYYCLKARTDNIIQRATGTTFKEISGSEMAETIIPLPPLKEQQRIANSIAALYSILVNIEKSLS